MVVGEGIPRLRSPQVHPPTVPKDQPATIACDLAAWIEHAQRLCVAQNCIEWSVADPVADQRKALARISDQVAGLSKNQLDLSLVDTAAASRSATSSEMESVIARRMPVDLTRPSIG